MDLQSLSLQAPNEEIHQQHQPVLRQQPYNGIPFSSTEKTPSWMMPNDRPPMQQHQPFDNNNINMTGRKASFAGHGRSVSEFTLPPLSSSPHTPPPSTSSLLQPLPPPPVNNNRQHHHRRAVSANTIDFMLSPSPSTSMHHRAQSYSPQEQSLLNPTSTNSTSLLFEQLDNNNTTVTADSTGRYVCPYCHKKFSRPSSLRIHTYSHTGEKPFVCTEPGCGRHFSVQSNMRRHLRVHRLGRGSGGGSQGNNSLETTNEEV
jgi:hypothetical protein